MFTKRKTKYHFSGLLLCCCSACINLFIFIPERSGTGSKPTGLAAEDVSRVRDSGVGIQQRGAARPALQRPGAGPLQGRGILRRRGLLAFGKVKSP